MGPFALQRVKRVKRALVDQKAVDVQQLFAIRVRADHVSMPNFFEQSECYSHRTIPTIFLGVNIADDFLDVRDRA